MHASPLKEMTGKSHLEANKFCHLITISIHVITMDLEKKQINKSEANIERNDYFKREAA